MPPVKDEMKAEKRELKQIGATAAAKMGSQHTRTAVIKATNTDLLPPKRKHINYLLDYMHQGGSIAKVCSTLLERTREKNWIVAMKALAVIHTLMKESRRGFMRCLASRPTNFRHMHNFLDKLNNEGFEMSWFIRKYAMYLEEKVATCREYGEDYVANNAAEVFAPLDNSQLCKVVAAIQVQLKVLLDAQIPFEEVTNAVQKNAYMIMMRECVRLYVSLNTGIITILERFFKMSKSQAEKALRIYELFLENISSVSSFLLIGSRIDQSMSAEIPALKSPPESLIVSLRKYVGEEAPAVEERSTQKDSLAKTNSNIARNGPGFQPIYHGQTSVSEKPTRRSTLGESAPQKQQNNASQNVRTVAKQAVPEVNLLDLDDGNSAGTNANPYATTDAFGVSINTNMATPGGLPSDLFGPVSSNIQEAQSAPALGYGHQQPQQQMYNGPSQGYYNGGMTTGTNYNTNTMQQGMNGGGYNMQQQTSYDMQQGMNAQQPLASNSNQFNNFGGMQSGHNSNRSSYDQYQNRTSFDQPLNSASGDHGNPFAMTVAVQQNNPMQHNMGMNNSNQQQNQAYMGNYQPQSGMQQIQNGMQNMQMGQNGNYQQQQYQQPNQYGNNNNNNNNYSYNNNSSNYQSDPFSAAVAQSNNPFD